MNFDNIPSEFKAKKRWIVWRREGDKKVPHIATSIYGKPKLAGKASSIDPKAWTDFATAKAVVESGLADGIGYALEEGYIFIDLDKCVKDGKINAEEQAVIDRLSSYTEISQSGTGLHTILKGQKPTSRCRKGHTEIYDHSRFIYLTGDVIGDKTDIEERDVTWLCEDTFDKTAETTKPTGDTETPKATGWEAVQVVLAPDAEPPEGKLKSLLKRNKAFQTAWKHLKKPSPDLSTYEAELTLHAVKDGWEDQEIADLLISFRSQHGNAEDFKKALRKDYIPRTIAFARTEIEAEADKADANVLSLLPFKVAKVKQYGEQDSDIGLVLDNGKEISMGTTDRYVSPRLAQARLLENQLGLPSKALKRWNEIILALQPLMEVVQTTNREENTQAWLYDWINTRKDMPTIEEAGDIKKLFGSSRSGAAKDREGRVYLRLDTITRYARVHTGTSAATVKTVAHDLLMLGFKKRKPRVGEGKQVRLWVSPPGFVEADVEEDDAEGQADTV